MKFWTFIENLGKPLFWLFDKLQPLIPVFIPIFALIGNFVVIYTIYYILITPDISWLWVFPLLLITVPVLFFFNRGAIEIIKNLFKKKR